MNKKQLAEKLINNESIKPFFPIWEEFTEENIIPNNLEEYITANKKHYNDLILYKFACGEHKGVIKQYIIDKVKMISNYNSISQYDRELLYILTDLLNKYFSIMPTEHRQGVLNNKQVNYSWNKVMQYTLIDPTKDKNYSYYQLQITIKDWINHAINEQKTLNKFTVDPLNRIYLNEILAV